MHAHTQTYTQVSLTSDGEVWSGGYGGYGQLGHGDELKKLVPTRVRGLGRPIAMVAAGESHVAVVSATGVLCVRVGVCVCVCVCACVCVSHVSAIGV